MAGADLRTPIIYGPNIRTEAVYERPIAERPHHDTLESISDWLIDAARRNPSFAEIIAEFAWRLVAAGAPLLGASLHGQTLHPQFLGATYLWWRDPGQTHTLMIEHGIAERTPYAGNIVRRVREGGELCGGDWTKSAPSYPALNSPCAATPAIARASLLPLLAGDGQQQLALALHPRFGLLRLRSLRGRQLLGRLQFPVVLQLLREAPLCQMVDDGEGRREAPTWISDLALLAVLDLAHYSVGLSLVRVQEIPHGIAKEFRLLLAREFGERVTINVEQATDAIDE